MRKWIAMLLALALVLSCALAESPETPEIPETEAAPETFGEALMKWMSEVDLTRWDYRVTGTAAGEEATGTLRQSGGITEAAVSTLGRVQVSEKTIALDIGGETLIVDLESLGAMLQGMAGAGDSMQREAEMLRTMAERVLTEVLLPFVNVRQSGGGIQIHVDATEKELWERWSAFVDELIEERNTLETLLNKYGPMLKLMGIRTPETFGELEENWAREKRFHQLGREMAGYLKADLLLGRNRDGGQTVALTADLGLGMRQGAYHLSCELAQGREETVLRLNAGHAQSMLFARRSGQGSLDLNLKLREDSVDGRMILVNPDGRTIVTLTGEQEEKEEDRLFRYAELTVETAYSSARKLRLEQNTNLETMHSDFTLDSLEEGTSTRLAALSLDLLDDGVEGTLQMEEQVIQFFAGRGTDYYRANLTIVDRDGSRNALEAWLFRTEDNGYRLALNTGRDSWEARISRNCLELIRTEAGLGESFRFHLGGRVSADGFQAEAEYLNRRSRNRNIAMMGTPFRVSVSRNGQTLTAEAEYEATGAIRFVAEGRAEMDGSGWIRHAEGTAERKLLLRNEPTQTWKVTYDPGRLVYEGEDGIYELRKTEDTAERLAYTLIQDQSGRLAEAVFTLAEDRGLEAVITNLTNNQELRWTVAAEEKQDIEPIPQEGAIVINEEFLLEALEQGAAGLE